MGAISMISDGFHARIVEAVREVPVERAKG
jgi:hypothetical protein